jgi:hypothetical protein
VTLTTHKAAREMGLEPIPGEPLNLMGVGGSQKTKSTVRYKIPLFDTRGRAVEVTAYGADHIMAPLEAADSTWMRAVFPEVPTGGIEAASGRVDLIIGLDNGKLFPVEHSRVQDAMLQRSRFGTGWMASGRPPGQGDPATSSEAATGAEEAGSAEATMDKPAKPPDRLDEQSAVSSAVCIQELEEAAEKEEQEELEEYWRLDEDLFWDERPPGEEDGSMPVRGDWSRGCGEEDIEYISGQAVPTARTYACAEVPEEEKEIGQQARLASIRKQQALLAAQPLVRWLPTETRLAATETMTPAVARREPTEARLAAAMSLAPEEMPKQPRECSQRTPQPHHLRDQPKGHSGAAAARAV